jgi:hypothetical protein
MNMAHITRISLKLEIIRDTKVIPPPARLAMGSFMRTQGWEGADDGQTKDPRVGGELVVCTKQTANWETFGTARTAFQYPAWCV